jgi:predicted nucleotidyltransferase
LAAVIENKRAKLDEICHWGVRKLDLCGSATRDDFTAACDLDFLVEFSGNPSLTDYLGLRGDLKLLFGREVDRLVIR